MKPYPGAVTLEEQMQADADNPPDMIGLRHTKGRRPCGKIAFWHKEREIGANKILYRQDIVHLDGSAPIFGSEPTCNSCMAILHRSGRELSLSAKAQ